MFEFLSHDWGQCLDACHRWAPRSFKRPGRDNCIAVLGMALGAIGLILAIPITARLKVICDHVDGWEPAGSLARRVIHRSGLYFCAARPGPAGACSRRNKYEIRMSVTRRFFSPHCDNRGTGGISV